jgi:outer membrane receptor protein involved in Fe transport
VQIRGSIDQLGPQRIVDECFAANPLLCAELRISQGLIARVFNPYLNVAQARVKCVDYEIAYRMEPNLFSSQSESLSLRLLGGRIDERSDTPFGSITPTRLEGVREGPSSFPEFQALLTAMYNVGPWSVRLTHRHIDDLVLNRTWTEGVEVDINTIDSASYTNAQINYTHDLDSGSSMRVTFAIDNVFDDGPPLIAGGANQTVDALYDIYGRRYFVSVNMDF